MTTVLDIEKLHRILTFNDVHRLEDILFYRDDNGVYHLFEQYTITPVKGFWKVQKYTTEIPHYFSRLRYALCYCINAKRNKLYAMQQIIDLDSKLISLDVDIEIQKRLINTDNGVYEMKLEESMLRKHSIVQKLQDWVEQSSKWQSAKFGHCVILGDK